MPLAVLVTAGQIVTAAQIAAGATASAVPPQPLVVTPASDPQPLSGVVETPRSKPERRMSRMKFDLHYIWENRFILWEGMLLSLPLILGNSCDGTASVTSLTGREA